MTLHHKTIGKMNKTFHFFYLIIILSYLSAHAQSRDFTNQHATEIDSMVDLSWEYMYEKPDSAYYLAQNAAKKSHEYELLLEEADCYNAMGVAQIVLSEYDTAIAYLKVGLNIIKKAKNIYTDTTDAAYSRMINRELGLLINTGNCHYHSARYEKAIEFYQKGNQLASQMDEGWKQAVILSSIGSSYNELLKFDLSLQYQLQSLKLAEEAKDSSIIANTLTNIGTVYFLMNEIEKSKKYTLASIRIYQKLNQKYFLSTVYLNMAQNLIQQLKFDSANILLEQTKDLLIDYPEQESEIFYHYQKGQYEEYKKNYLQSINHYRKAYLLSKKYDSEKYKLHASYKLEDIYASIQRYDSAYYYLKISKQLSDSVFSKESDEKIAEMEIKYQVEKKEIEIENLEKQTLLDKKLKMALLILITVIILSSTLIIISYVLRRKKTKQLYETEKKLMATEIEKNHVIQQKMSEDLEYKTRQLTTHALNMMQKNKLLQEVNKSIAEIIRKPDDLDDNFRILKRQINKSIRADKDWDVFKMYFEQINKSFFIRLKEINPNLSAHDLKLSALIKLNLNIKESAAVLNLSPNSIKSARYKLRKRLFLKPEDDLSDFIQNIS